MVTSLETKKAPTEVGVKSSFNKEINEVAMGYTQIILPNPPYSQPTYSLFYNSLSLNLVPKAFCGAFNLS
jgi:hypothetical protein